MKIKKRWIALIVVFIIIIIMLVFVYGFLFQRHLARQEFARDVVEIYEKNKEKVFKVEKIILCSSANAIDISKDKSMKNLSIYQYTDIGVYIDNGEELSNKNTVKEIYIDNISFDGKNNVGKKSLTYKNLLNFGLKEDIFESRKTKDIEFNVVYTNEEDSEANYDKPTFYTDCSNPITLSYVNYNLLQGYQMEENNQVNFDGSILEKAGIGKDILSCKVKFKINIINNQDEKYSCWMNIKLPLDDIYKGTTMKSRTTQENENIFFRE